MIFVQYVRIRSERHLVCYKPLIVTTGVGRRSLLRWRAKFQAFL